MKRFFIIIVTVMTFAYCHTGTRLKVNSAIDSPSSFFSAKSISVEKTNEKSIIHYCFKNQFLIFFERLFG
jgi:hypothetical protein